MMLDHYQQTKNLLVSYTRGLCLLDHYLQTNPLGFF
jgi:hypothetical protein